MEVLYHIKPYFGCVSPYIALTYLHRPYILYHDMLGTSNWLMWHLGWSPPRYLFYLPNISSGGSKQPPVRGIAAMVLCPVVMGRRCIYYTLHTHYIYIYPVYCIMLCKGIASPTAETVTWWVPSLFFVSNWGQCAIRLKDILFIQINRVFQWSFLSEYPWSLDSLDIFW